MSVARFYKLGQSIKSSLCEIAICLLFFTRFSIELLKWRNRKKPSKVINEIYCKPKSSLVSLDDWNEMLVEKRNFYWLSCGKKNKRRPNVTYLIFVCATATLFFSCQSNWMLVVAWKWPERSSFMWWTKLKLKLGWRCHKVIIFWNWVQEIGIKTIIFILLNDIWLKWTL